MTAFILSITAAIISAMTFAMVVNISIDKLVHAIDHINYNDASLAVRTIMIILSVVLWTIVYYLNSN